jgi:hypothetical protein
LTGGKNKPAIVTLSEKQDNLQKLKAIEDPRSKLRGIFDPNLVFSYFNAR